MNRVEQIITGVLFAIVGLIAIGGAIVIMILAKSATMWGFALAALGALFLFWGGVIVPNSGVEESAKRMTVIVGPVVQLLQRGRRGDCPKGE